MRDGGSERSATNARMRGMVRLPLLALSAFAMILLAACGSTTPAPPHVVGGTYTSAAYHFSVSYPDGWSADALTGASPSATIPLTVVITRTAGDQAQTAVVSTFTVTVLNAKDQTVAVGYASLPVQAKKSGAAFSHVTVAGRPAIEVQLPTQQVLGSSAKATHTDYYIWREDYEYHLSTDAVEGDGALAALQAMLQSFTLTQ